MQDNDWWQGPTHFFPVLTFTLRGVMLAGSQGTIGQVGDVSLEEELEEYSGLLQTWNQGANLSRFILTSLVCITLASLSSWSGCRSEKLASLDVRWLSSGPDPPPPHPGEGTAFASFAVRCMSIEVSSSSSSFSWSCWSCPAGCTFGPLEPSRLSLFSLSLSSLILSSIFPLSSMHWTSVKKIPYFL